MATEFRNPTRLFVSHISEEAEVAALIKKMMQEDFLGLVEFFTSSDVGSIDGGDNWLSAVQRAMDEAAAVVVLCSKASVQRPWVQFEIGAAWMKRVPIIPICHSGMQVGELPIPLSLYQGGELGTERGLEVLYQGVSRALNTRHAPRLNDLPARLKQIEVVEENFRGPKVQQFERFIDIVLPRPGRLEREIIPDEARVESDPVSLELFGFIPGGRLKWGDIRRAAKRTADTRWLVQLQRSIYHASNNESFKPVQAIYHNDRGSFQPQLAKKELLTNGECRFHVHFVDTVVAPLSEVQNDFGLLATLLRLGLRFRYEVIESFKPAKARQRRDETLQQLRAAVEVIENDALSRGAENIDREAVSALFERDEDQREMESVQDEWDAARILLFKSEPSPTTDELIEAIRQMRDINYRFMNLGTRRFHEMVRVRWRVAKGDDMPPLERAA